MLSNKVSTYILCIPSYSSISLFTFTVFNARSFSTKNSNNIGQFPLHIFQIIYQELYYIFSIELHINVNINGVNIPFIGQFK